MTIVAVGIDLAKNVFAVHGVGASGKPELVKPDVKRKKLLELIASLPPCLIGMEACSGAHYWAREFQKFGHTVRIMAPKFVAPYRLGGKHTKNDAADAAAICEAVTRPQMRFVPIKHGGKLAISSSSLLRFTSGFTSSGFPDAPTPCTAKTFLARSIPTVTIDMDFPSLNKLMKSLTAPSWH